MHKSDSTHTQSVSFQTHTGPVPVRSTAPSGWSRSRSCSCSEVWGRRGRRRGWGRSPGPGGGAWSPWRGGSPAHFAWIHCSCPGPGGRSVHLSTGRTDRWRKGKKSVQIKNSSRNMELQGPDSRRIWRGRWSSGCTPPRRTWWWKPGPARPAAGEWFVCYNNQQQRKQTNKHTELQWPCSVCLCSPSCEDSLSPSANLWYLPLELRTEATKQVPQDISNRKHEARIKQPRVTNTKQLFIVGLFPYRTPP